MTDLSTVSDEKLDELVDTMTRIHKDIDGPGMSTTIRADQLGGLVEALRRSRDRADLAERDLERASKRRAAAGKGKGKAAAAADWTGPLAEVIAPLADLLESSADLWGRPLIVALDEWTKRNDMDGIPPEWKTAIERALAGGAAPE